jgi:hypothetical protein
MVVVVVFWRTAGRELGALSSEVRFRVERSLAIRHQRTDPHRNVVMHQRTPNS